jgi:hypothetical protein
MVRSIFQSLTGIAASVMVDKPLTPDEVSLYSEILSDYNKDNINEKSTESCSKQDWPMRISITVFQYFDNGNGLGCGFGNHGCAYLGSEYYPQFLPENKDIRQSPTNEIGDIVYNRNGEGGGYGLSNEQGCNCGDEHE